MAFLFGPSAKVKIKLTGEEKRKKVTVDKVGAPEALPLYTAGESVSGQIDVDVSRKVEHNGIRVELIGQIELFYDRGNAHEFTTLTKRLAGPGTLHGAESFQFDFRESEMPFESYNGINVRLRYTVRLTMDVKKSLSNVVEERDIWVRKFSAEPEINSTIKMEVGIEDCLHIEFEYNKSKYHLKDVIIGKIYFLLVKIKIRHMELSLIKRETTGSGPNQFNENKTLIKYEIMDGAPVRGESVPIRLFLGGFDLTPSYTNVHKKFSVQYYLNLVIVDEHDRRYFKQSRILLRRRKPSSALRRRQPTMKHDDAHDNRQKQQQQQQDAATASDVASSSSSSSSAVVDLGDQQDE
jgi:vacuolar protein sorting-associated protein 26A/B